MITGGLATGRGQTPGGRDQSPVKSAALAAIDAADNLLPPTLATVKADATVGEISDMLRGVWGEHQETLTI